MGQEKEDRKLQKALRKAERGKKLTAKEKQLLAQYQSAQEPEAAARDPFPPSVVVCPSSAGSKEATLAVGEVTSEVAVTARPAEEEGARASRPSFRPASS